MRSDLRRDLERLGGRAVRPAPGDGRDLPSDWHRPLTRDERARNVPETGGRERSMVGVGPDESRKLKRMADRLVHAKRMLEEARRGGE